MKEVLVIQKDNQVVEIYIDGVRQTDVQLLNIRMDKATKPYFTVDINQRVITDSVRIIKE